jgi:hypothetical protein
MPYAPSGNNKKQKKKKNKKKKIGLHKAKYRV